VNIDKERAKKTNYNRAKTQNVEILHQMCNKKNNKTMHSIYRLIVSTGMSIGSIWENKCN